MRWRRVVYVALVSVLLLEATLQLLAIGFWCFTRGPSATPDGVGAKTVLCIGDSYTFGMGASDQSHSYPSQLEEIIRERVDDEWRVRNLGYPGRNSREVLQRLDAELKRGTPKIACILIGLNDEWTRPAPLQLDSTDADDWVANDRFRWTWRIPRLFRTFRGRLRVTEEDEQRAFEAAQAGATPRRPHPKIVDTGRSPEVSAKIRQLARESMAAFRAMRYDEALRLDTEVIELAGPESLALGLALHRRCRVHSRRGSRDAIAADTARLRELYRVRPIARIAEQLLAAFAAAGDERSALEFARKAGADSDDPVLLHLWADREINGGDKDAAREIIARAVAALDESHDDIDHAIVLRTQTLVLSHEKPEQALRSLLRAHVRAPDRDSTLRLLRPLCVSVDAERFRQIADETVEDADSRAAAIALYDELTSDESAARMEGIFRSHMEQMVWRCRRDGVRPVFIGYPLLWPQWYMRAAEEVADETGALCIRSAQPLIDSLLRDPSHELYVADGHCNDDGYRLMAEAIAAQLIPIL